MSNITQILDATYVKPEAAYTIKTLDKNEDPNVLVKQVEEAIDVIANETGCPRQSFSITMNKKDYFLVKNITKQKYEKAIKDDSDNEKRMLAAAGLGTLLGGLLGYAIGNDVTTAAGGGALGFVLGGQLGSKLKKFAGIHEYGAIDSTLNYPHETEDTITCNCNVTKLKY